MPKLHLLAASVAASVTLAIAAPASAAPVTVNLRVEGSAETLFEGPIVTDAKQLTKDSTGAHPCDGTNLGAHPTPGATMTGAMDDGGIQAGYTWDATWDNGFQDFFISRIGPDTNTSAPPYEPYWGYFKNWLTSNNGGCQEQVGAGDEVLFAYSNYGQPLLQLAAPARAEKGQSFDVTVEQNDGAGNRTPALAASVETASTDASGHASLMFDDTGNHTFKATRSDAVRSNARTVCVYVPGSGDCGTQKASDPNSPTTPTTPTTTTTTPTDPATPSEGGTAVKDTTPPIVHVDSLEPGKTYTQGPRVLSGSVDESGGIAQVFLRLTASDGGDLTAASRCRWFSGKRGVFTHRVVPCARSRFFRVGTDGKFSYLLPARLGKGEYKLDVKVLDRAYNAGRTAVPFSVK